MKGWKTELETKNVEYYTPKFIVEHFGRFDYDPATTVEQAEYLGIRGYDTKETNGLLTDWTQYNRIWINPPFDKKFEFFAKAVQTYKKVKNEIYFLCPIEFLTTLRFFKLINDENVNIVVYVPNGRVKFLPGFNLKKQTPAFGSVILKLSDTNEIVFVDFDKKTEEL